jgi:hypothetical protein
MQHQMERAQDKQESARELQSARDDFAQQIAETKLGYEEQLSNLAEQLAETNENLSKLAQALEESIRDKDNKMEESKKKKLLALLATIIAGTLVAGAKDAGVKIPDQQGR